MEQSINEYIESLGLDYSARFIPASHFKGDGWRSNAINHAVSVGRGRHNICTNYSQGVAHLPNYKQSRLSIDQKAFSDMIETGETLKKYPGGWVRTGKKLPAPSIVDVIYSLLVDSSGDFSDFGEWCADYGYDTDSRKAEKIFNQCRDTHLKLNSMFTPAEMETLNILFEDY